MYLVETHGKYPYWLDNAFYAWKEEYFGSANYIDPSTVIELFEVAHNIKLERPDHNNNLFGVRFMSKDDAVMFLLRWS
jgi:hypothetical protein